MNTTPQKTTIETITTLSPASMSLLDGAINECVNSLVRQKGEVDFRKSVFERVKETIDIDNKTLNALVAERRDDKISERISDDTVIVDLNDSLIEHRRKHGRSVDTLLRLGQQLPSHLTNASASGVADTGDGEEGEEDDDSTPAAQELKEDN